LHKLLIERLNYLYKSKDFKDYLFNLNLDNSALLLMSSGNYGGLNFDEVKVGSVIVHCKNGG
jgi:hypothetical protein